jgi:hypothetical protein
MNYEGFFLDGEEKSFSTWLSPLWDTYICTNEHILFSEVDFSFYVVKMLMPIERNVPQGPPFEGLFIYYYYYYLGKRVKF